MDKFFTIFGKIVFVVILTIMFMAWNNKLKAESPSTQQAIKVTNHQFVTDYNPHTGVTVWTHHKITLSTGKVFYSQILTNGAQPVEFPQGTTQQEKDTVNELLKLWIWTAK